MTIIEQKDAYICYNGADLDFVRSLSEQVESETIDGSKESRSLSVFFDKWDIEAGQSLIDRMNAGMKAARHVVAVLSPEFLKADWPRFEWKHIVAADPNNSRGVLIPILLRDLAKGGVERIDLYAPFRDLRYIDFRKPAEFRRSFVELMRRIRNQPAERGRRLAPLASTAPVLPTPLRPEVSWLPDRVQDVLISNLLRVTALPARIWGAATDCREKKDVWAKAPSTEPFVLREKRIYTFADLNQSSTALRAVIDPKTIAPESRHDWFIHPDKRLWLMALLNTALNSHMRTLRIKSDGKGRFIFMPEMNGGDRRWPMLGRKTGVAVAAKKTAKDGISTFWVHHGASLCFKRVGNNLYVSIEPHYLFTLDGNISVDGKSAGKLATIWGGKQQNPDILRNILFWGFVMAKNHREIRVDTGGEQIVVARIPATSQLDVGVAFDEIRFASLFDKQDDDLAAAAANAEFAGPRDEPDDDDEKPFE
ncbi:toll/interleukin-1 receptor domain-containing protein [Horticoccus luteus]|uniref:Toll/interleukin-1 receptor domain-containing protein n=1 Tax=Horticoccus luteus TaxID=2862869 RepID=A0A8F9TZ60_9BACT|nr:toll/interleukin-1 receptor domain-containing protein [Horticoccus luteus]QYM80697.1 toll/interleukin-1 receptor domain-containing protein [Horticoccus luteus]